MNIQILKQFNTDLQYQNLIKYKMFQRIKNRAAFRTLIGVMLIKFATGAISSWGSVNLYILSYFYHEGVHLGSQTNSIIILFTIIPISFLVMFSTKLSDKFGYENIIIICSLIFVLSPMVIIFKFNFTTMVLCCLFLPASGFSISTIPVINCLWTQFPKQKNMVTAFAVVFFGVGGVFWNYMFTLFANPNNQSTIVKDVSSDMNYFSKQVSSNVYPCLKYGSILCGSIFFIGALLITKNKQYQDSTVNEDIQLRGISEVFIEPNDPQQIFSKISLQKNRQQIKQKEKYRKTLKQALLDYRFVSIFLINFLSGIYQIFLMMNLKIIYMPIIHDDRFLVYCSIAATTFSIFGAFIWGYIGDKKDFYYTLVVFAILDLFVKFYGVFAKTKETIFLLFILIGFVDKGALTIIGPGLVKIFGIQTATQLLPYKGLSMFIGFVIAPLGYILLNSFIGPFQYLFLISFLSIISVVLSIKLYRVHKYK